MLKFGMGFFWGGNTKKSLDMDEQDMGGNGRRGKEEAMVWECERNKGRRGLVCSLWYNGNWGEREEAPVYLSRNVTETIITQDWGMCLRVHSHQTQARTSRQHLSSAAARDVMAANRLLKETARGVDSQAAASLGSWADPVTWNTYFSPSFRSKTHMYFLKEIIRKYAVVALVWLGPGLSTLQQ